MNVCNHLFWNARDRDEACAIGRDAFGERGEKVAASSAVAADAADAVLFARPDVLAWWVSIVPDMFASGVAGYVDDRFADRDGWGTFDVTQITCPVTVLHGAIDGYLPVANAHHTAAIVPGATLRILDGVGHISIATKAVEAARELLMRDTVVR